MELAAPRLEIPAQIDQIWGKKNWKLVSVLSLSLWNESSLGHVKENINIRRPGGEMYMYWTNISSLFAKKFYFHFYKRDKNSDSKRLLTRAGNYQS